MRLRLHILIDHDQHGQLQRLSKRAGMRLSDLIRTALDDFLAKTAKEQAVVVPLRAPAEEASR